MYLYIDLGVTFTKIAILKDNKLGDIKRVNSRTAQAFELEYLHQVNAETFFQDVKYLIDDYLERYGVFEGIFFSTQMHGFVLCQNYEAKSPYYTWKHESDKVYDQELLINLKNHLPTEWILNTGMNLRSGLPSINMHVLALKGELDAKLSFGTIADFIVAKLTKTDISTSLSNAAGSGLYDLSKMDWNYNLAEALSIKIEFPLVISDYNQEIGKYNGIPIYPPIGDQQAAVLGVLGTMDGTAIANIATGSQSTVLTNKFILNKNFQTRPLLDDYYLLTIPFLPAGRALNALVTFFEDIGTHLFGCDVKDTWERLSLYMNANVAHSDIKANIDFFNSFSAKGGSFDNLNERNFTLKNIMNAVIQDLVNNHIEALKVLGGEVNIKKILLSGGIGTKIKYIKKLFVDQLGCSIVYADEPEDTLNGLKYISLRKIL